MSVVGFGRNCEPRPVPRDWREPRFLFVGVDWQRKNGEAVVTQNGLPFVLGRRPGGWFAAERGSFEFSIKPGKDTLRVDLGAGDGRDGSARAGRERRGRRRPDE